VLGKQPQKNYHCHPNTGDRESNSDKQLQLSILFEVPAAMPTIHPIRWKGTFAGIAA